MKKILCSIMALAFAFLWSMTGSLTFAVGETVTEGSVTTEPSVYEDYALGNLMYGHQVELYLVSFDDDSAEVVIYYPDGAEAYGAYVDIEPSGGGSYIDREYLSLGTSTWVGFSITSLSASTGYRIKLTGQYGPESSVAYIDFTTTVPVWTVTYDSNGGSSVSSEDVEDGNLATEPSDPTRTGYTFDAWYTDDGTFTDEWIFASDTVTENITLYANWDVITYTVTYDSNDGSAVSPENVDYGGLATEPSDPTRVGYTFDAWYTDDGTFVDEWIFASDTVTENITLYANWDVITYTVTYDSNDGSAVSPENVDYGDLATEPSDPTRTGYTFDAWYTDDGTFTDEWIFASDTVTENITLYAKWDVITYTVIYDSNEGSAVSPEDVDYGDLATEPSDPTRTGYTFDAWYTDDGTFLDEWIFASDTVTSNITLYANWTINIYTVTYDSNEGSAVSPEDVDYGDLATEPSDPTRMGYTFDAWYTDDGTFTDEWLFASDTVTENITLYANWLEAFTVSFDSNGGSAVADITDVITGTTIAAPTTPTRLGFTFVGWFTDDDTFADEWIFASDTVTEDITLYAKWTETPVFEDTPEGDLIALIPVFYVVAIIGFEVGIMRSSLSGGAKAISGLTVIVVGLALLPVIAAIVQALVG